LYHLVINEKDWLTSNSYINTHVTTPITNNNLWHFGLGHLFRNRLDILRQRFPFIPKHFHEYCDVCHLAKQRKLSYLLSLSKASSSLELLHLDIWGPFSKNYIHGYKYFLVIVHDYS